LRAHAGSEPVILPVLSAKHRFELSSIDESLARENTATSESGRGTEWIGHEMGSGPRDSQTMFLPGGKSKIGEL
jgi:hypothetical protein